MVVNMVVQKTESSIFEYNNIDVFFCTFDKHSKRIGAQYSCAKLCFIALRCVTICSVKELHSAALRSGALLELARSWQISRTASHNGCGLSSKRRGAVLRCAEKLLLQHSATQRRAALN